MASSIASPIYFGNNGPKGLEQNAIDKVGGIFCHICRSVFANKNDFDGHYTQHGTETVELLYTCVVCKKQMASYTNFHRHCYLNHVANTFQCEYCNRKFDKLSVLDVHISAVHEFKCHFCTDKFPAKECLDAHNKVVHGNDAYVEIEVHIPKLTAIDKIGGIFCHVCDSVFGNKKEFDGHYRKHDTGDNRIVYTCVVCKKQTSNYPSFRGHCYLVHVVKDKFQCQHCPKSFNKPCVLNSHTATVHNHKCPSCNEKFTSKRDLEIHKKVLHSQEKGKNQPPYNCLLCDTVIKNIDACEHHIDNHCETLYPCPICKEVLPNKPAAAKHLTNHFDEKLPMNISTEPSYGVDSSIDILGGILCCHCNSLCRNRADLEAHFRDEHNGKPIVYTCNVCRKPHDKYDPFGKHCYDHFARGKFQCDQCDKTFTRLSLLVIHTEAFHTDCLPDKPFGCDRCGHGYMTSGRLQEHLRVVHEEGGTRSRCMKPGCSAVFEKPRDLIEHLKDHNALLDNWCKVCGLQFTTISSAEKHLDVHRDKQYSCPVCKRTYREKYLMVKHVPTHFEAVIHICKVCGKGYNKRNRLIHHLKSHSETRNHQCTYCSKSFMKPHELVQHLNTHTGLRPYTCTICPKTFANYPNWSKHLNRVHSMDKTKIKQLNAELKAESGETQKAKTSPAKTESGIESAGSELSDIYSFLDSDDSNMDWTIQNFAKPKKHDKRKIHTKDTVTISDTVKAAIDRIDSLDENLDWAVAKMQDTEFAAEYVENSEFITETLASEKMDDEHVIKEIVDHIDAMSNDMEVVNRVEAVDSVSELDDVDSGILQYADMTPVDNTAFNTVSGAMQRSATEAGYPQAGPPEYGPDLSESLTTLEDHELPHIDPLLTIKPEDNATMYVQNFNNYENYHFDAVPEFGAPDAWPPPLITKVFNFDENNDVNNMYIY